MKKSFSSRRVARRIGDESGSEPETTVVKRPSVITKSAKRKSAVSRLSFGPSTTDDNDAESSRQSTPKLANKLGRLALERSATREGEDGTPLRAGMESDRPSYTTEFLRELQASTPTLPRSEDEGEAQKAVTRISNTGLAHIPSVAEIREKKARRARLAQEQEYISLEGSDSDGPREVMLLPKENKYGETRLVPDDEDMAEGFDEYVDDGTVALGRKAERKQKKQRRAEMASMIAQAEGVGSDVDSDVSEAERVAAYDAAQTRAGTYGSHSRPQDGDNRPKTPPKITPVPDLPSVLQHIRAVLEKAKEAQSLAEKRVQDLAAEKIDVAEREVWVQEQLKEIGEKYEHVLKA
ncbi:hypothetical protein BT63DRAFT_449197 [Microthyrium microscopicum]|uniref:Nineteen complex-related protein 2-domain-containing protein n=1 Tax=Microthyrium microscopicum TaxID=703497 RepID=A0A6A6UPL8_9PEZI|nr:hypothetical protein BT63DRAFT_449197 [Microthyrium microscopicum]